MQSIRPLLPRPHTASHLSVELQLDPVLAGKRPWGLFGLFGLDGTNIGSVGGETGRRHGRPRKLTRSNRVNQMSIFGTAVIRILVASASGDLQLLAVWNGGLNRDREGKLGSGRSNQRLRRVLRQRVGGATRKEPVVFLQLNLGIIGRRGRRLEYIVAAVSTTAQDLRCALQDLTRAMLQHSARVSLVRIGRRRARRRRRREAVLSKTQSVRKAKVANTTGSHNDRSRHRRRVRTEAEAVVELEDLRHHQNGDYQNHQSPN